MRKPDINIKSSARRVWRKVSFVESTFNFLTIIAWCMLFFVLAVLIISCVSIYYEKPVADTFDTVVTTLAINKWDWVAVVIAAVTLFYGCITFNSQHQTERNTMRITPESQRQILIDYIRHYYRNLVIICAVETKLDNRFDEFYPSQEHLLKLKVELSDLHPAAFYNHSRKYHAIHELLTKMRNFNTEIDVAVEHLCDRNVFAAAKRRDFATLKFKMCYLAEETMKTIYSLWLNDGDEDEEDDRRKKRLILEVKRVLEVALVSYNKKELPGAIEYFKHQEDKTPYFKNADTFYTNTIFTTEEETRRFLEMMNCNIYAEIKAKNSNGFDNSEKIFLIPFQS